MNILIVGNGFDLSHYLPTKYDHFMDVMRAIEDSKSESMNFDALFSECREDWFIAKTKEYYLTGNIVVDKEQLERIRNLLKENCWYQYFKNHLKEIDTWIDFEQKIEYVLSVVSCCINDLSKFEDPLLIYNYFDEDSELLKISKSNMNVVEHFGLIRDDYHQHDCLAGLYPHTPSPKGMMQGEKRKNLNQRFCHGSKINNGFNASGFLNFIYKELEKLIEIFDLYLDLIVSQLSPMGIFDIQSKFWVEPDKIFSFNYTNTYQRIYDSVEVEYLHGSHGEFQNIVLGISDLLSDNLKELKAFGFTKYHQKLFKDTDYVFLDEFKRIIDEGKQKFDTDLKLLSANALSDIRTKFIKRGLGSNATPLDLNFMIWGHSLDISDKDYILDLFSLNDEMDRNVRITVFYYDKNAKFSLLNNLLSILGKDKVEKWMKNQWLRFEKNPEIDFGIEQQTIEKEAS